MDVHDDDDEQRGLYLRFNCIYVYIYMYVCNWYPFEEELVREMMRTQDMPNLDWTRNHMDGADGNVFFFTLKFDIGKICYFLKIVHFNNYFFIYFNYIYLKLFFFKHSTLLL